MREIAQVLDFIVEIEKLKNVIRHTRPVGLDRYENSAEHSWHVCLAALMLKDYADEPVDIDRVIRMLLIHDLGEIDAGDKIIYASETAAQKDHEAQGVKRILALLPEHVRAGYFELWQEFEAGESAEARFARAIDRVPPLLHNLHGGGHSWREHQIPRERVFGLNSRIGLGSSALWEEMEKRLQRAVDEGLLK
ncbi:HD domain-containing protein [Microbulbifer yueqingensis]|uniref:Putative hydrolases of HD superfamily n=1 Tax=Microbulbifer yueqingensis TaxID=658219 RepID=A0A1G8XBU6_9GAMM|nr:HD domain-containing protein [Microbulbifer yueqingensis]SDJ87240.1 putative hydrolases of HD superfamily [Microbulbifer yueqingensis]